MYHSLKHHMNFNNNGKSKEWIWDEGKGFEENLLLEYPKEGQWDKPVVSSRFELSTCSDNCNTRENASIHENKATPLKNKTKKVLHWKEEEHRLFLEGLEKYGRGNWKAISKLVGTKSYTQVASHAQKHFIRVDQESVDSSKKSKRRSKFDTTSWNGDFHPLLYREYIPPPPPSPNVETQPFLEYLLQQFQQYSQEELL